LTAARQQRDRRSTGASGNFTQAINIVLDGPPDLTTGRFVEVKIDGVPIPQQPSTTDRPDGAATGDPAP
jgi:hypothetical protein